MFSAANDTQSQTSTVSPPQENKGLIALYVFLALGAAGGGAAAVIYMRRKKDV